MDRLSSFPYVVVRVECTFCPWRRGRYRLARLAERYGAEIGLDALIRHLSADCPWQDDPARPYARRRGNQYVPRCHARFADLWTAPPPDLPPDSPQRKLDAPPPDLPPDPRQRRPEAPHPDLPPDPPERRPEVPRLDLPLNPPERGPEALLPDLPADPSKDRAEAPRRAGVQGEWEPGAQASSHGGRPESRAGLTPPEPPSPFPCKR